MQHTILLMEHVLEFTNCCAKGMARVECLLHWEKGLSETGHWSGGERIWSPWPLCLSGLARALLAVYFLGSALLITPNPTAYLPCLQGCSKASEGKREEKQTKSISKNNKLQLLLCLTCLTTEWDTSSEGPFALQDWHWVESTAHAFLIQGSHLSSRRD